VNDSGAIVGNVSVSDVRALATDVLTPGGADAALSMPVMTFLGRGLEAPRAPITVKAADSLATLTSVMDGAHVHRVHVVDDAGKPIGVVTAMDVLRVLVARS
jgi:CBS domain-containing protein